MLHNCREAAERKRLNALSGIGGVQTSCYTSPGWQPPPWSSLNALSGIGGVQTHILAGIRALVQTAQS